MVNKVWLDDGSEEVLQYWGCPAGHPFQDPSVAYEAPQPGGGTKLSAWCYICDRMQILTGCDLDVEVGEYGELLAKTHGIVIQSFPAYRWLRYYSRTDGLVTNRRSP